jgi:TonB family protein
MKSNNLSVSIVNQAARYLLALLMLMVTAVKSEAAELVLNGVALHQELNTDYFLAGLYLPVVSNNTDEILAMKGQKRMEMRVAFDNFSPRKFAGLWRDSIVINNSPADIEKFGPDILRFASVMKGKLVRGDQVLFEQSPAATVVSVNGIEMARFSPDFFNLLLRTWIGPRPATSDFKKDLLNKGAVKEEYRTRYNSLVPLDGRKQLATLWVSGTSAGDADAAAAKAAEESRLQAEAEARARAEADALAKAEAKARAEAELKAQAEAKARAEMQLKVQAEAKARQEAEAKARAEALAAAKAAEEAIKTASDATAKAAAEAKAKAAEVARQRAEAERAQAEAKARVEDEARLAAEAKAKAEAQARADAAAKAKAEADARALAAAKAEEEAKKRAADLAARQLAAATAPATATVSKPSDEDNEAVEFDPAQAARELYKAKLVAWVYKSLEYPEKDKRARKEGSVQAKVTINRDGSLVSTELLEETRYASLNLAAKNATKLAQPYPAIPKDIDGQTFEFTVPILFRAE